MPQYSPDPILAAAAKTATLPPKGTPHGIALPGSQQPGYSAVYRHYRVGTGDILRTADPSIATMFDAFEYACRRYPSNNCLGWRERDKATGVWGPFQWIDYQTVQQRRSNLAAGFVHLHQQAGETRKHFPIGIWSVNRPEWQITDLACMAQALYSVSIYDTLGPDAAVYIINHAEIKCIVCSLNHVSTLLRIKDQCPDLKLIISIDPLADGEAPGHSRKELLAGWAAEKGVQLLSLADVELLGTAHPRPLSPPSPDDPITINYTSGTTGPPKGVILSHANCVASCSCAMSSNMYQTPYDVMLSYLPLAHIYGRLAENAALWGGAAIGYFHGDILKLVDDLKELRPTTFVSVPRLFNRIASAIRANTVDAPGIRGALSRHALAAKLAHMHTTGSNRHALYDRIWANKVKAAIGLDRCRAMVSGSAPIAPDVLSTLRAVFGNDLIEGYGLTETYAVALGQLPQDNSTANCGPPSLAVEVRLRDVPNMGYTAADQPCPRGELLVRGHSVFKQYYKSPATTADAIDADGWFATGDICYVDRLGRFSVVDRVKNLLKLAQGEYVSPEKIENQYLAGFPVLAQGLVHGDSLQPFLVAVFGVDRAHFAAFASAVLGRAVPAADDRAILAACADRAVRAAVLAEMDRVAARSKLAGFERVRNVHLCLDPFTIENDLLTPTLKMKRVPAIRRFKDVCDALYEEANRESRQSAKL